MSVVIETTYEGETFEVEVFHDGHLEFPGRDLEYDQAMAEFTSTESAVILFSDFWKKTPIKAIAASLWVVEEPFVIFMADCAERVLPTIKKRYPDLSGPKRALDIVRVLALGGLDENKRALLSQELSVLSYASDRMAGNAAPRGGALSSALWAISEVADAKQPVWRNNNPADIGDSEMCVYAADQAETTAARNALAANRARARFREMAWQVRRFVDVMEALGQGKPWPPFKRTR